MYCYKIRQAAPHYCCGDTLQISKPSDNTNNNYLAISRYDEIWGINLNVFSNTHPWLVWSLTPTGIDYFCWSGSSQLKHTLECAVWFMYRTHTFWLSVHGQSLFLFCESSQRTLSCTKDILYYERRTAWLPTSKAEFELLATFVT